MVVFQLDQLWVFLQFLGHFLILVTISQKTNKQKTLLLLLQNLGGNSEKIEKGEGDWALSTKDHCFDIKHTVMYVQMK